ncbi:hypothetical protein GGR57DRAFT_420420 [Xylariaceae sp. FL1272]|nr:hypothetical protein GGR57DRAFT_420420 [Xylariaceae sp. FL1272]
MPGSKWGHASGLDGFLDSLKLRKVDASTEHLVALLKRRQIKGSEACATATAHILLQVVAKDKWTDVDDLLTRIQLTGRRLVAAQPRELVIGNIVRRVLGLIRDEASEERNDNSTTSPPVDSPAKPVVHRPHVLASLGSFIRTPSNFNLLSITGDITPTTARSNASTPKIGSGTSTPLGPAQSTNVHALRSEVIDGIEEIMDEIKQVDEQIQSYADTFINPGDYVLVHQPSKTVQKFLTRASLKRKFTVFVAVNSSPETKPEDQYASLRKSLASHGSNVIIIMNAGLMVYMSRVDKVILSGRAITAQGGVIVDGGAVSIAQAARERQRDVMILGGVYKVCPDTSIVPEDLVEWGDPSKHVSYGDGVLASQALVRYPVSEYLPGESVNTYITNLGAHVQDNLQTIIAEHYKEEDIDFDLYTTPHRK